MKKLLSILPIFFAAVLFLTITQPIYAAYRQDFYDVPSSHTYFVPIDYLRRQGVVATYNDGSFRPERFIKRSEFVAMVVRARGFDHRQESYYNCFVDVTNQSFADEVCFAKARGWLNNYRDYFYPSRTINSPEAYQILADTFGSSAADVTSYYAYPITRGQAADSIYKTIQRIAGGYDYYSKYNNYYDYSTARYKRDPYLSRVPDGYPAPWVPDNYADIYYSYDYYTPPKSFTY